VTLLRLDNLSGSSQGSAHASDIVTETRFLELSAFQVGDMVVSKIDALQAETKEGSQWF
jgi:hypothetical protein